jgi:hypothetical protein
MKNLKDHYEVHKLGAESYQLIFKASENLRLMALAADEPQSVELMQLTAEMKIFLSRLFRATKPSIMKK